ncbi:arabinose efflux permease family protein [Nitzschia inconspicua]|uniref:Arabinose efflux permease family protein n=1 Tax=Nitzschia inconspicua TaxID=303405 RepID=A0A9K3M1U9_9STRA|nr:arabinose efflux permease family protein [Nitzschia inconspicua]
MNHCDFGDRDSLGLKKKTISVAPSEQSDKRSPRMRSSMETDHEARTNDSQKDRIALLVTYLNIVLYALCFQLQRPVEPFLVTSLSTQAGGNSAQVSKTYGQLQSFFNAVQTIGSPLVGILLDRIGIRDASVVVFASTALSYLILAYATDMNLLFLSKVPTVLQAAFLVAQATASTATGGDAAARAQALGRMTTAYTIGATIGPVLGGWLADHGDLYFSAKVAVVGSLVSVILSWAFLPTATFYAKTTKEEEKTVSLADSLKRSLSIGLRPNVLPLLAVKLVGGVVASIFSTALPLVLTQQLHFDASQLGLGMSASMFSVAGFSAIFMAPLAKWIGPDGMVSVGLLGRACIAPMMAMILSWTGTAYNLDSKSMVVVQVTTVSVFHALSAHLLATGLTTLTTGTVEKDEQGALLGLEHSLFSLARIAGPAIGTTLLASKSNNLDGFWLVAGCSAVIDVLLMSFLFLTQRKESSHFTKKM